MRFKLTSLRYYQVTLATKQNISFLENSKKMKSSKNFRG
jgi:hypothetical protein